MNNKTILWALVGVLVIAGAVYFTWAGFMKTPAIVGNENGNEEESVMCPADAFQCPDGAWVGRSGKGCQFVCPIGTTTQGVNEMLLETSIDNEGSAFGTSILPLELVEDSRCAIGVQCIHAGTVRVRAQISSGLGTATEILKLGTPMTTEAETITLFVVTPTPETGKRIREQDYKFIFKVVKRQ